MSLLSPTLQRPLPAGNPIGKGRYTNRTLAPSRRLSPKGSSWGIVRPASATSTHLRRLGKWLATSSSIHENGRDGYFSDLILSWEQSGVITDPNYDQEDCKVWRQLFSRAAELHGPGGYAAPEYLSCVEQLGYTAEHPPSHLATSEILKAKADGWKLAPVRGSISGRRFQTLLSQKMMPTTMHLRCPKQLDFTPDPDCFHEMVGHAPILLNKSVRELHYAFGQTLAEAEEAQLRRAVFALYFAVCEAGLLRNARTGQVQAIGASVLTGISELQHCVNSTELHQKFSIDAVLEGATLNEHGFKHTYFVGDSVAQLCEECMRFLHRPQQFLSRHPVVSGKASDRA